MIKKRVIIKEAVSLIKGSKDKPMKLVLLRVNESGTREKINDRKIVFVYSNK